MAIIKDTNFLYEATFIMLYMIYSRDVANSLENRLKARPAHLERLEQLEKQGRLFMAGPLPAVDSENPGEAGFTGSLVVAEFESLNDARQWAAQDPYIEHGVYDNSVVKPFKRVFPK